MNDYGARLLESAGRARQTALLVAPFVKANALARILECICPQPAVTVIARWLPLDIAQGVCDIEIFDLLAARPKSRLLVHPLLHAKMFRFDNEVFFGSANITDRALGWRIPSNIELVLSPTELTEEFVAFESEMLSSAIPVDSDYRNALMRQVEKARAGLTEAAPTPVGESAAAPITWLPSCNAPRLLWTVYSDPESARRRMVENAFCEALSDLSWLGIAQGFSLTQFNLHVAAMLRSVPLVQGIDLASKGGLNTADAVAMIGKIDNLPHSAEETWEVLQAWLEHFFPNRYLREVASTIFRSGSTLSKGS
jgi:hypothetical protein